MSFILVAFLAFLQSSAPPKGVSTNVLVDGVERSFARMKDLSADFVQFSQDSLNRKQQVSGHLYLMRPRMMRFEYKVPEETLWVSNGKNVYHYVPADRQVSIDAVRDTLDDRIPLMFLLGRSNLRAEFTQFDMLSTQPYVPGTKVLRMYPRRKTDLTEIVMEVDPASFQMRRLALTHSDGSRTEFVFSNIRTNTGLSQSLFNFKIPPGVEVIEGIGH
jgi:outer membrane lipoprotein carrier protein